jgi:hypothetical protein
MSSIPASLLVWRGAIPLVSALLFLSGTQLNAFPDAPNVPRNSPTSQNENPFLPRPSLKILTVREDRVPLKVQNIRFESGPNTDASSSVTLKFDMVNASSSGLTNIVLEISILRKRQQEGPDAPPNVLVHPFVVREQVVLQPGYSMEYELRFQNLSANGDCVAQVDVISVDSLLSSKSP